MHMHLAKEFFNSEGCVLHSRPSTLKPNYKLRVHFLFQRRDPILGGETLFPEGKIKLEDGEFRSKPSAVEDVEFPATRGNCRHTDEVSTAGRLSVS